VRLIPSEELVSGDKDRSTGGSGDVARDSDNELESSELVGDAGLAGGEISTGFGDVGRVPSGVAAPEADAVNKSSPGEVSTVRLSHVGSRGVGALDVVLRTTGGEDNEGGRLEGLGCCCCCWFGWSVELEST